ncbi:MAG: FtsX-like permease family protein [Candidatus Margulisiibacteriota bacterium]|jgi:ABC-type lipoprotein release transport system permease subunit
MFTLIAFRNILANKRKSIITIILSILCTIFVTFSFALTEGTHLKMIKDSVETYTGYLMVVGTNYINKPNYDNLIYNLTDVEKIVHQDNRIVKSAPRLETFALFSSQMDSLGGMLIGIVPEQEQYLSRIKKSIYKGRYLETTTKPEAIIGEDLADKLKIKIGDQLTYLSNALDSSIAADNLQIIGLFHTGSPLDASMVFISKKYMDSVFLSEGVASHYVMLPKNNYKDTKLDALKKSLNAKLPKKLDEVVTWKTVLYSLVEMVTVDSIFNYFSYGILVMVIFFVIMIFSLISILQRTKEIGVLRAMGTKPYQILIMLFLEALILGMISIIIGGIISLIINYYFCVHPIHFNFPEEMLKEYQKWGLQDFNIPTKFSFTDTFWLCLMIVGMNLLAVVYPALKVIKLKPIEAINYV